MQFSNTHMRALNAGIIDNRSNLFKMIPNTIQTYNSEQNIVQDESQVDDDDDGPFGRMLRLFYSHWELVLLFAAMMLKVFNG